MECGDLGNAEPMHPVVTVALSVANLCALSFPPLMPNWEAWQYLKSNQSNYF